MDVFGGAPRFLAYPRPVVVQSGTDAVLKCQIGGDPRPAVIWERNNEKIDPQGRYRVFEDGNVYNLIITAVTIEDSGQYICKAKNSIGETYAAATLKVEGEAQEMELREENKPRFLIKPLSTRVGRGEDAVFSCKLWGNPRPEVVWEKDGRKLNEIFESTHFSVGYQDGGWFQLKIFKTRAPDGGVYTCKARNEFGEALAGAVLLVDAGPGHEEEGNRNGYTNGHWKVPQGKQRTGRQVPTRLKDDAMTKSTKVKMFAVTEGKHAKFRCFVTGKPKPEIIWRKDGRLILSGRRYLLYEDREGYFTLKVLYCKQKDNGVYVCAASNTAGQTLSAVHLAVKEPPVRFKQPLYDLEVWERDLAVLECEVPEDSVPITWYLEDRRLQPGAKYGMEEWGTKRRLTIRDIGVDDDGIYLCEMPDGGRSIAEVAVKGTILRKLPRKVDVLEGENAAFCVEVEKEEMDIHWYKDGIELRETHQTILKSFGRTHILVFVNTMPQDSGLVTFLVGRSKTSSQLRVKAARHCPPSCPVGVQINTERANAALLSWVPAPDSRKNPPSGYVLERQEVGTGSQEWLQCLTTDSATSVEILGDSVPCEADYRFRICSVNKYGKSNNVEFPRTVHLVPVARIQAPLQDALVPEGQDALFTIELSASVIGTWFLNGTQLQDDERYSLRRSRTHQSLRIRGVRDADNGAEITFIAYGIRDSAALYIQAPLVKFSPLSEMDRNKFVEVGNPIVLYCELSDPAAPVHWYKNGVELQTVEGLHIQSEGTMRRIVIQSADFSHSGVYCCDAIDDVIRFNVEVEAPPVRFSTIPDAERSKSIQAGGPFVLQCELSDPSAQVYWYKDGSKLHPQTGVDVKAEGLSRKLVVHSAEVAHSGLYCCKTKGDAVTFSVEITAPPVTFTDIPEKDLFRTAVEQEQLILSCEVSRADGVVQWYKDGTEIQPCNNVSMEAEGTKRNLIINSAKLSDTGAYTCRTGDNILIFKVNIREPPVMIVYPKEDVHLDRHVPEEIILSCELSRPNGAVGWFKDGQKLQESENIKLKYEGPYRRLKILCSRVEDSGEYVCDTADDSIFFHLSITEPPVQILSPSQSQMELCQQTSERMVLSCEISRPNAVVRWYRDGLEVEESENLLLEVDGVYRRLIIPETTVRDSAEYVCDTGDDSVTFFVNIAEPPVRFLRPRKMPSRVEKVVGETLVLDCEVSRSNAEVTWKKNGEEVEDSRKVTILEDGVTRQLTIHSVTVEDAGQYVCDAKDDVMDFSVRVQDLPVRILGKTDAKTEKQFLVSDDIILVCELSNANASVRWYKDGQLIDDSQRYCCEEQDVFRSLVVLNAGLEDSGEYSCYAGDDKMAFTITVREPPVQIIGNSGNPEHHVMVTGDDLILECEVSRPNADVEWTRNGEALQPSDRIRIDSYGVVRKFVLSGLQPSDSGEYVCEAIDDKLVTVVEVQDPPAKFLNKKGKNKMSAYENESATLCAVVSSDRANVRWLKDGQLLNKDNIHISSEGKTHKLTINPLQLSDSGEYVCDVNTDEMFFSLLVEEMKVKFVKRLENVTSPKGKTLTLQCEVNKPKGDVQWLKDGKEMTPSRRCTIRAQGRERSLTIQQLRDEDAGEYVCESTDDRTAATVSIETPRVVEFIAELRNITIREGEDAVFKCVVSPADTALVWRLNGKDVALNERTAVSCNGLCHMLCISSCLVSDSGRVTADAEGLESEAELAVQEQQALFTKKMAAVAAEEYSEATLEVEVSQEAAEVQWMRQGILIHPGAKYTLKHRGRTHSLTIHQVAAADRGAYSCETLHDRTQAQLAVEPRKISIKRGLTDIKTTERETASFEVELSHANVPGTWIRNGIQLKPTNHFRMSAKGEVHSLTISNLSVEDTGSFVFSVENLKTSARLVVKEPPVTVIRKLENQKVPDGSVISFDCELSRHNVDAKWMKDGVEVKPCKDVRIYAMGRKRFLQIMKCSAADSGLYACDAGDAATSCAVEVYERELLVLQGLEDLDIQEDQNAVFVCEISVEDVPGEWYKNGERIQPTSTVKIRQEGTKHFLLMCNVRSEDSGEIKFVARNAESVAYLEVEELPVNIVKPLQDTSALEKSRVVLDCTVSNPRCSIRWYKGSNVILPSERFEICSEGCYRKLIIQQVALEDDGTYSVQVGDYTCSAKLSVEAQSELMVRELSDVAVSAPDDACFECEVSAPAARAPAWSLNGEPLQPSPRVRLENMGTVHRLTLRQTAADMSGLVEFTSGKARSQAQLRVAGNP
ncbi:obscurin-like protein 1 isoform X15 [Poecilia reticulata]|uniref:obscurin-like protein 1 isoform X15 n=1 Tax=Poecilia reticulata TaxID=8081 RepID=UPI0007EBB420|nr:PREDICTED: obscurin-like protein 1 isoform X15 [Poecilia reticulata]